MNILKKSMLLVMMLSLIIAFIPSAGYAENEGASVIIGNVTLTAGTPFLNSEGRAAEIGSAGDKARFEASSGTLTLMGADITEGTSHYGITSSGDLKIVLEGTNTISGENGASNHYGIYCGGNLTISGSGSLDIKTPKDITLDNNNASCGIFCSNMLTINSGTLTVEAAKAWFNGESVNTDNYGGIVIMAGESSSQMSQITSAQLSGARFTNVKIYKFVQPPTTYTVTNNIVNGSLDGVTSVYQGASYSGTIKPDAGSSMPDKSALNVKVGGVPLSSDAYSYDSLTGGITIPADKINGNIVISAMCIPSKLNLDLKKLKGGDLELTGSNSGNVFYTVNPNAGRETPTNLAVSLDGKDLSSRSGEFVYDPATGKLTLPSGSAGDSLMVSGNCSKITNIKGKLATSPTVTAKVTTPSKQVATAFQKCGTDIVQLSDYVECTYDLLILKDADGHALCNTKITFSVDVSFFRGKTDDNISKSGSTDDIISKSGSTDEFGVVHFTNIFGKEKPLLDQEFNVKVEFAGSSTAASCSANMQAIVTQTKALSDSNISINNERVSFFDDDSISGTLLGCGNDNGLTCVPVAVTVGTQGDNYPSQRTIYTDANGDFTCPLSDFDLTEGTYTVTAVSLGNDKYASAISDSKTITITANSSPASTSARSGFVSVASQTASLAKYSVGRVTITKARKKTARSVTIPATMKIGRYTYNVTSVSGKAFKSNKKLKKVTIKSKQLTSIGTGAFRSCAKGCTFWLPKDKYSSYKKLLKKSGLPKNARFRKI